MDAPVVMGAVHITDAMGNMAPTSAFTLGVNVKPPPAMVNAASSPALPVPVSMAAPQTTSNELSGGVNELVVNAPLPCPSPLTAPIWSVLASAIAHPPTRMKVMQVGR